MGTVSLKSFGMFPCIGMADSLATPDASRAAAILTAAAAGYDLYNSTFVAEGDLHFSNFGDFTVSVSIDKAVVGGALKSNLTKIRK